MNTSTNALKRAALNVAAKKEKWAEQAQREQEKKAAQQRAREQPPTTSNPPPAPELKKKIQGSDQYNRILKLAIDYMRENRFSFTGAQLRDVLGAHDKLLELLRANPKVDYQPIGDLYSYKPLIRGINNLNEALEFLRREQNADGVLLEELRDCYVGIENDLRKAAQPSPDGAPPQVIIIENPTSKERLNEVVYWNIGAEPRYRIKVDDRLKEMWLGLAKDVPDSATELALQLQKAGLKPVETTDLISDQLLEHAKQNRSRGGGGSVNRDGTQRKKRRITALTNAHMADMGFDFGAAYYAPTNSTSSIG
eukprot:GEZU01039655.1.p1 GENE.GEZU01039655.1~~GEZU01039655.1.p1  ORF type:complete len:309 (+),score=108.76 GEZU01039655.1:277-1203(+)